jgi:acyl-coenzyme A synthetase/AMP-(fatty) acid ligase
VVVPVPGASVALADVQRLCEQDLAPFKKPRRLELVESLPRTPATGQVQRIVALPPQSP